MWNNLTDLSTGVTQIWYIASVEQCTGEGLQGREKFNKTKVTFLFLF